MGPLGLAGLAREDRLAREAGGRSEVNLDEDVDALSAAAAAAVPLSPDELGKALAKELVAFLNDDGHRTDLNGNTDFTSRPMTALKLLIGVAATLVNTVPSAAAESVKAAINTANDKHRRQLETLFYSDATVRNELPGVLPALTAFSGATTKMLADVAGRELTFAGRNTELTGREVAAAKREADLGEREGKAYADRLQLEGDLLKLKGDRAKLEGDRLRLKDQRDELAAFQRLGFFGKIGAAFAGLWS